MRGAATTHVALVRALHGHVLVHLLDVQDLVLPQRDLRVRHNVLHDAVDDAILGVRKQSADGPTDAQACQQALVPGLDPRNHQLPAREEQRRATWVVDASRDGRKARSRVLSCVGPGTCVLLS
jgi:hypothetical protein